MAKPLKNIYPGLRAIMAYNGDGTEDVAKLTGCSLDTVRRQLAGRTNIDIVSAFVLSKHYSKTVDELFGERDE